MKNKIFKTAAAVFAAATVAAFGGCDILEGILGGGLHEHSMQFVAETAATCTEEGEASHYHCDGCGGNFNDRYGSEQLAYISIPALGHDMSRVDEKQPTCAEEGNVGYYLCSRCGGTFSDEEGKTALSDVTLGKTAHTYQADVWKSDSLTHWNECCVCGERLNAAAHTYGENNACTVCGYEQGSDDVIIGNEADISSAELSIHFIAPEVKASGDSTLIKVGDTEILVDAGPTQSNVATIKAYLDKYCDDGIIEYVIATHADRDHIAGFVGNKNNNTFNGIFYSYTIETLIQFDLSNSDTVLYNNYKDAVEYLKTQGTAVYTGLQCWNGSDGAQRTYYLDEEQTISLNILYNYYYEHDSSDENNYSVCFLLTQEFENGEENNYLFTGDLEAEGEEYLVEYNELPEVELFKAGHHGSPTSSNDVLLSVIKPKNVAVCCCAGSDEYTDNNANQFPSQAFVTRVSKYTENVYVTTMVSDNEDGFTSMNGDIVFYYNKAEGEDEGSLKLWCSNNTKKLKDTEWFAANRVWG